MQNTRLNTFVDRLVRQFAQWITNPWRRTSVIIISLLLGNFLASAIVTTTGQWATLDITVSLIMVAIVELISWLRYSNITKNQSGQRSFLVMILESLKLGLVYGLFLEAFKLGS